AELREAIDAEELARARLDAVIAREAKHDEATRELADTIERLRGGADDDAQVDLLRAMRELCATWEEEATARPNRPTPPAQPEAQERQLVDRIEALIETARRRTP